MTIGEEETQVGRKVAFAEVETPDAMVGGDAPSVEDGACVLDEWLEEGTAVRFVQQLTEAEQIRDRPGFGQADTVELSTQHAAQVVEAGRARVRPHCGAHKTDALG